MADPVESCVLNHSYYFKEYEKEKEDSCPLFLHFLENFYFSFFSRSTISMAETAAS